MKEKVITQITRTMITINNFTKPMFQKPEQEAIQNLKEENTRDDILKYHNLLNFLSFIYELLNIKKEIYIKFN